MLGHAVNILSGFQIDLQYRFVAATFVLLPLVFLIARKHEFKCFTVIMNPICLLLVLLAALPTGFYYLFSAKQKVTFSQPEIPLAAQAETQQTNLPDVYLIIMDGYSREDWFKSRFDFDNRVFISALEERGFIFPDCAKVVTRQRRQRLHPS